MIDWLRAFSELATEVTSELADLTESELKVLCAATTGQVAHCGYVPDDDHPHNDPEFADFWDRNATSGPR